MRKGLYEHACEICTQTVFVCSEVGVSHDGIEEDDSYVQQFTDNEVEVDSLWAQTRITEGCPLSALNKGIQVHVCFHENRIEFFFRSPKIATPLPFRTQPRSRTFTELAVFWEDHPV